MEDALSSFNRSLVSSKHFIFQKVSREGSFDEVRKMRRVVLCSQICNWFSGLILTTALVGGEGVAGTESACALYL